MDLSAIRTFVDGGAYEEAIVATGELLQSSPSDAEILRLRALSLIGLDRLDEAERCIRRAVAAAPLDGRPASVYGMICRLQGRQAEALVLLRRGTALAPDDAGGLARLAALLFDFGMWSAAFEAGQKALVLKPTLVNTLFLTGCAARNLRRFLEAEDAFRRALALRPSKTEAVLELANLLLLQRNVAAALDVLLDGLAATPGAQDLLVGLAHVAATENRADLALEALKSLQADPRVLRSLRLKVGQELSGCGAVDEAIALYRDILEDDPEDFNVRYDLSVILYRAGNLDEAEREVRGLLAVENSRRNALLLLSQIYVRRGDLEKASRFLKAIVRQFKQDAKAYYSLGNIYRDQEAFGSAYAHYKRAVSADPSFSDAYVAMAEAAMVLSREELAADIVKRALALKPKNAPLIGRYAEILIDAGRWEEAEQAAKQALALEPGSVAACDVLARLFSVLERHDEAFHIASIGLTLEPHNRTLRARMGMVLTALEEAAEARILLDEAIVQAPDDFKVIQGLVELAKLQGNMDDAVRMTQRILRLRPESAGVHCSAAMNFLYAAKFGRGFDEYEWAFLQPRRGRGKKPQLPQPEWAGEPLQGRSILVYSEQGVGDEIMFATAIPELIRAGARVFVDCGERLIPLYERTFPTATILARGKRKKDPRFNSKEIDYQISIGSLARFLRRNVNDFGRNRPFLVADRDKVRGLRARYRQDHAKLIVGIGWKGGSGAVRRKGRSMDLSLWKNILSIPGITFVSVQYGEVKADIAAARAATGAEIIYDETVDPLKDMDISAAQIGAMDLVISATNAGVHTAGALGVPCWALVPFVSDWRWTWGRTDALWYPGMRIFRQPSPQNWEGALEEVAENLKRLVGGDRSVLRAPPAPDLKWTA